jgi:hypothetical protein
MRIAFAATIVILLLGASAHARDIFVDNVLGDDRRAGTMAAVAGETGGPCRSIAKALRIALPGDRIVVAKTARPYRESITIQGPRHSGDDRYPLVIVGNGATLDGTFSLADARWEHVGKGTFRTRPPHLSYQQLFLDDAPLARKQPPEGEFPKLAPREWCLFQGWIYFCVEAGKLPPLYNLSCCGEQVGITLYEVHDVVVQDLAVRGFWLDGVNCHDNVKRTDLVRITASHNGRSGISIGGSSRVRIDTCAASGNGAAQVRVEGYCTVQMLDNELDTQSAPALLREGGRIVQSDVGP